LKWIVIVLLLLFLILYILLKIPSVQSNLAQRATKYLNKTYHTSIHVAKIDLTAFPNVDLNGIVINDHHNFPFIKAKQLTTSLLNWKKIIDNELLLDNVAIDKLDFVLKTYKGENEQNIIIFSDKFNSNKPRTKDHKNFILTTDLITLNNSSFYFYDENKQPEPIVFYNDIDGEIFDFKVDGSNVFAKIKHTSFIDNYGIEVTELNTGFTYTKSQMHFEDLNLATKKSFLQTKNMVFNYSKKDLSDFNNKVQIEADITKAEIALSDLHLFYDELGKNDVINFTTKFKGVLNDFFLEKLKLTSKNNSIINGKLHFFNAINRENGFALNANLSNLTSDYKNLKQLLPNLLGKTLPSSFAMLGRFKIKGVSYITTEKIDAQLEIDSDLGKSISDLKITNITNIDKAKYKGKIELVNFDLGRIIKDSLVGNLSLIADVDGSGFTQKSLNTRLKGRVTKHQYKGYTYSNIDINGVFKDQHFNGDMQVNDKNIKMTFDGLADLSQEMNSFKFKADVDYANFNKLNLFKRDSISILKGKIDIDLMGNSIDNIIGKINIQDASYTNQNDLYKFKKFDINSSFKDSVRTLTVNSKDIINGKIEGKFKFAELPTLAKNSLGSIYTHYKPDSVSVGQYLKFNFKVYDKIIGVFFPEVSVGKNTFFKGKINSDKEKFELTFKSPKVKAYDNLVEKIRLQIDNKNPLYNTILSIKNIETKQYNAKDINLVNVTLNDTLFIRSDFIGGKNYKEHYNLSLFHTINKQNQSVIGFKKSDFDFKNQKWEINPNNDKESKVIFDSNLTNFDFKKLKIISDNQELTFNGKILDKNNKDLHLNFKNVALEKITRKIDSIALTGILNGKIDYLQKNEKIIPKANISINKFEVNKIKQGDLLVRTEADKDLKKYRFNSSLIKDNKETFSADGSINLNPKEATIDAVVNLSNLDLSALSPLGGENITKIRGEVTGKSKLTGLLRNPNMDGALYVKNAGLAFPYLNTEYEVKGNQKVSLHNQTFDINQTTIIDVEKRTEGTLTGSFTHTNFLKWYLDLKVKTDNLLVLNTEEDEDTPYYGTGLMNGKGTIIGPTDGLVIEVEAITNPGTEFIVPLSDVNTIEEDKLVRFVKLNEDKKEVDNGRPDEIIFDKGLTLKFELEVTEDAIAQIVIDKATGSLLRGRGYAFLDVDINTNGKFEMAGTYVVKEGVYELKNIVSKTFKVKNGGTISWNGSPFDAYLNITAIHSVKANPSILLENLNTSRDIDVDLVTKITGNLYEPKMQFDIKLPKAHSVIQSELAYRINDEDKKMTQFFSLVGFGTFINPEKIDYANSGSSLVYSTISEKISNVISNIINNDNDLIKVGVNLDLGETNTSNLDNLKTDDQVDITFKTNLYKKIEVNGVVGVPIGSKTQSSIVGEIEVELPLNKAENFRAKMYSRRNEVQFDVLDTEGYTQGLGLSYQFNWDTAYEFLEKIGLKKSVKKKKELKLKKEAKKKKKDSIK